MIFSFRDKKGFTLIEMLVTLTILSILAASAVPLAKIAVKREKEIELRRNLRLIRNAIDEYKKLSDEKKIEVEEDTYGYPPDLETLVIGVEIKASEETEEEQESDDEDLEEELSEDELKDEEKTDQDEEDEAKQVKEVE
jgi:general secretion pathway protein G